MTSEIFGRFHPLLVHFPIGFLFLAFFLELFSGLKLLRKIRGAVRFSVSLGLLSSILAALTGWFLSDEGGYEPDLLFRHRLFGLMSVAICLMLWVVITYGKNLPKPKRRPVRIVVFVVLVILITITGHFGGSMTHGRNYLSPADVSGQKSLLKKISNPTLVYADIIRPILDQKCISCHGEKKQKAKLRLDTEYHIRRGGINGSVLADGKTSGELVRRISLPVGHEDQMPPNEKEQLSMIEIEILKEWIARGASFNIKVRDFDAPALENYLQASGINDSISWWPEHPVNAAPESAIKTLSNYGAFAYPIASRSHYIELKCTGAKKPDQSFWKAYMQLAEQIVTIDLSQNSLTSDDLINYSKAKEIRKIYLKQSKFNGNSLSPLLELKHLRYLNLTQSDISFQSFATLAGHSSLLEVFAFGTKWDKSQVSEFNRKNPGIKIDTGTYKLPFLKTDTLIYSP